MNEYKGVWLHHNVEYDIYSYIQIDDKFVIILSQEANGRLYSTRLFYYALSHTCIDLWYTFNREYFGRWEFDISHSNACRINTGGRSFSLRNQIPIDDQVRKSLRSAEKVAAVEYSDFE
jgi:hypothetical protein